MVTKTLLLAGAVLLAASACTSNVASDSGDQAAASAASEATAPEQSPPDGLHQKQVGETGGWGCSEDGDGACTITFAITNIETVECEYPEIYQLRDGHSVIRIDLDVSTTQELQEDWTNQLGTLLLNQWSVTTPDGYSTNNLPDKTGCVPNVEQTDFLLPATKTRPTAVIEVPDDALELQLRPAGMDDGGGWSWPLEGVIK